MIRSIAGLGLMALASCGVYAQPSFEVASIKPSAPPSATGARMARRVGCSGGPGSTDPGLLTCTNMNLSNLVTTAYDVYHFQLSGPDWMDTTMFDIAAKIPPGTTKEQLRLMEQRLLVERFKLTVHHENKEMQMYELSVGKNGPKLKESVEAPAPKEGEGSGPVPPPPAPPKFTMGSDGFPVLSPNSNMMIMINGRARRVQTNETMGNFARFLSGQLGRPVTDATGLNGKYDTVLTWASEGNMPARAGTAASSDAAASASTPEAEPLPTIIQAVQALGLKLEQKKGPVDILVIDHAEKQPTEN